MKKISLLLIVSSLFWGCSDSSSGSDGDLSGATGVGNPTKVAISSATGEVVGSGEFANDNRSVRDTKVTIYDDSKRAYHLDSIIVNIDRVSWQVESEVESDKLDKKLSYADGQLTLEGPFRFNTLDKSESPIDVSLPTGDYKKIRFYFDSDEKKKATVSLYGVYEDGDKSVKFAFEVPLDIELKFSIHGKPYHWESDGTTHMEAIFDLDEWFDNIDWVNLFGITSTDSIMLGVSEFNTGNKLNTLRNNIRKSGVLKITPIAD